MFCKTCSTLLVPKKTPYGQWMSCPNGHTQPELQDENRIEVEKGKEATRVQVADDANILAVHDYTCTHCGYDKAEMLEIGAMYSDEDSLVQMKCGKCSKVSRLEGKLT